MTKKFDKKKNLRQLKGRVVSDKNDKTIIVEIKRIKAHLKYQKRYYVSLRLKVHDPKNEAKVGDVVLAEQCRQFSHDKHYRLKKIIV